MRRGRGGENNYDWASLYWHIRNPPLRQASSFCPPSSIAITSPPPSPACPHMFSEVVVVRQVRYSVEVPEPGTMVVNMLLHSTEGAAWMNDSRLLSNT